MSSHISKQTRKMKTHVQRVVGEKIPNVTMNTLERTFSESFVTTLEDTHFATSKVAFLGVHTRFFELSSAWVDLEMLKNYTDDLQN